jgi:hypothetical protein
MARNSDDRSLFLKMLAEHPYIFYAAKKSGISPATIHRWMNSNPAFKEEVNRIKREGLANQNESVEMVLVKKSLEGNIGAIKFYLPHNSKKYRPMKADWPPPPISEDMRKLLERLYKFIKRNNPVKAEKEFNTLIATLYQLGAFDKDGEMRPMWKTQFGHLLNNKAFMDRAKRFSAAEEERRSLRGKDARRK